MLGTMHFIYYINRLMALKLDSTDLTINQQHITYIIMVYMSISSR